MTQRAAFVGMALAVGVVVLLSVGPLFVPGSLSGRAEARLAPPVGALRPPQTAAGGAS
eukprot:CAMPEP_0204578288 /NCGR_PEP_ID=MMETSP0661-20131031/42840_1 /ASSEMBLY_ACC=CAM_ASM_000606 /TAXON_ID=109239 /ORGANISM="Alexandrium margalefi, Strain AMGDE01CS-322" /LENGTH=57 /DNA_ID=CAMNT_0051587209 /DNA_START=52 /DNA_END=222 /DNA_ORIENTATION=-